MKEFLKDRSRLLEKIHERYPTFYFFGDLAVNILIVVVLVYTVRTYLISPFQVFGPSMCDTLNYLEEECQEGFGEYLIVNKTGLKNLERGDIIVFRPPQSDKDFYIKRIIGLPGETIKLQNGKVFVVNENHPSGSELPEEYLNESNQNKTWPIPSHLATSYKVPEGKFFVMGDNRRKSTDSRSCFRGIGDRECQREENHFLDKNRVEGKAWVVLWPFNKVRLLGDPVYEPLAK